MAALLLGPMLRYVDDHRATVWVETDAACQIEVLEASTRTFSVGGHHYGIVPLEGLPSGKAIAYQVRLDGEPVWPEPGSPYPPSVIRTVDPRAPVRLAFGSCRVTAPHQPPYTLSPAQDKRGHGVDALRIYADQLARIDHVRWPTALLMLGDQVYADEVSPQTRAFLADRRDISKPPGDQVADFEEYTRLYREAWSEPQVRWLLSTVPSAMVFDDHDVHDDWNTSHAWREAMQRTDWWQPRIEGGLMSYWLYQHIGNLSPEELAASDIYRAVRDHDGDAEALLRDYAACADREVDGRKGARWSYRWDFGATRLVVIDSRCGRVLVEDHREMVDEEEWCWVTEQATGAVDHLLLATSLPYLLPPGIHYLEAWDEAISDGAWGPRAARIGEKIRQAIDLEHWAAFERSFREVAELVRRVASGQRGRPPATVIFLSGDVHFGYVAQASLPGMAAGSRVYQAVCSPMRNPIGRGIQRANRFARSRPGAALGRWLARLGGVRTPPIHWRLTDGPWFGNLLATLELNGRAARLAVDCAPPYGAASAQPRRVFDGAL